MGSKNFFQNKVRTPKSSSKSKGERLGWVSIKEAPKEDLLHLLQEKEWVVLDNNNSPLLIP